MNDHPNRLSSSFFFCLNFSALPSQQFHASGAQDLPPPLRGGGANLVNIILDPFCGNGAMGVAAVVNGRKFVGVEYNPDRARSAELAMEEINRIL